jgi:hypothetical protein
MARKTNKSTMRFEVRPNGSKWKVVDIVTGRVRNEGTKEECEQSRDMLERIQAEVFDPILKTNVVK